jgi:rhodanese-related sulfurtransferase
MLKTLFSRTPDPADLNQETFAKAVRAGEATVVDVREPREFAAGHIPGSMNLSLSHSDPRDLPMGGVVALIRQAGGRSRNALARAHAAGRDDVKHFAGGMSQRRIHCGHVAV